MRNITPTKRGYRFFRVRQRSVKLVYLVKYNIAKLIADEKDRERRGLPERRREDMQSIPGLVEGRDYICKE